MRTPWDKLVASLLSNGPLTDHAIERYALAGRYGSAAKLRAEETLMQRAEARRAKKESHKRQEKLSWDLIQDLI